MTERMLITYDRKLIISHTTVGSALLNAFERAATNLDYAREHGIIALEHVPIKEGELQAEQRIEMRGYERAERDIVCWLRVVDKRRIAEAIYQGRHRERR